MFECASPCACEPSKGSTVLSGAQTNTYRWLAVSLCTLCLLRSACVSIFAEDTRSLEKTILTSETRNAPEIEPKQSKEIILDGRNLSIEDVVRVARLRTSVRAHPVAQELPRFLSPENSAYGLGILENTSTSLNAEIRHLSNPVSADYFPRAGEIEDRATNSALVVDHVARIVDNLYYILGMELFHASQAVDLRRRGSPHFSLGRGTKALYEAYREAVPFLDKDRILGIDIEKSHNFLLAWN